MHPDLIVLFLSLFLIVVFPFQGVIILDANGESCDGDVEGDNDDEKEPVECSNNFVFVGAEIRTGKSSIRSKQSKRKVSIQGRQTKGILAMAKSSKILKMSNF